MNSSTGHEKTTARRLIEASAWRTHLAEHDLESTPAFESWLADKRNREAWERVQQGWNLFGDRAASPELMDLRRRALDGARKLTRERWNPGALIIRFKHVAIAASLVLVAVGSFVAFNILQPADYQTAMGERRTIMLADGSRVQLDSLTELRVKYSKHTRDLQLIKGQAHFDVAHDVERPFSVAAGGQKIVATGTAFNVDLLGRDLYVTLLQGKVMVLPQKISVSHRWTEVSSAAESQTARKRPPTTTLLRSKPIELQVGQQLAISQEGEATVVPARVKIATAWQSGQLVFEDEPMASVVARVNRYAARPVMLTDEKMASLRISGVFNAGDVDGFIATVTHYFPLNAQQSEDAIYLRERSAARVYSR